MCRVIKFGKFVVIIPLSNISAPFSLSSPSGTSKMHMLVGLIVPTNTLGSVHFSLFFFLILSMDNFNCLVFKFMIISSNCLNLLLNSLVNFSFRYTHKERKKDDKQAWATAEKEQNKFTGRTMYSKNNTHYTKPTAWSNVYCFLSTLSFL